MTGRPFRTAMLLAAGLGRRMRPLTDTRPKPLVEVAGKALLDHVLDRLGEAGVETVVVNVHYLADQIVRHVASRSRPAIVISDETDRLLDSGGGVKKALPILGPQPFVICNADSFWIDGPRPALGALIAEWDPGTMDILMLLAPLAGSVGFHGPGDYVLDPSGRLERRGARPSAPFAYAGVLLASPRLFEGMPDIFSLNRLFDTAEAAGRLHGRPLDGTWFHVGTPEAIGEAEARIGMA